MNQHSFVFQLFSFAGLLQVATAYCPSWVGEWWRKVGIVRQSLCLSRVATPPLSQALNAADTLPQKGEQLQTFRAHWRDWKEVAGEALKSQFMRVAKIGTTICAAQQIFEDDIFQMQS